MAIRVRRVLAITRKLNKLAKSTGLQLVKGKHIEGHKNAKKPWKAARAAYVKEHILSAVQAAGSDTKQLWRALKFNLNSKRIK
jgi:hypothetical protein